jgi:hypothetical protein
VSSVVSLVALFLYLKEVITSIVQLFADLVFLGLERPNNANRFLKLLLKILFSRKHLIQLFNIRLQVKVGAHQSFDFDILVCCLAFQL